MPDQARILLVDDEPNVLHALRRSLRSDFVTQTAVSGMEALRLITESEPFSVIVSDCRMPEMDGIEFLENASKISPDSVRIMLTGNADQDTAVRAINSGDVFKFLSKPCDAETLRAVIAQAVRQHELVTAEKELLETTLRGSINVMADLLAVAKPEAFGSTSAIRLKALAVAEHFESVNTWEMDTAALLSQLGCVNVAPEILAKMGTGESLTARQRSDFVAHPKLASELIGRIPRLERVAKIILYQNKNFDGTGFPADDVKGQEIPIESRILRGVLAHDELRAQGWSDSAIQEKLAGSPDIIDPRVLDALGKTASDSRRGSVVRVPPAQLKDGMVLEEDVKTDQGVRLLCRGQEVTAAIRGHLSRFQRSGALTKPILVQIPPTKANGS